MIINKIIEKSIVNRGLILFISFVLTFFGIKELNKTPLDALPDLSDVQVIVKSSYAGQDPSIIEEQITYPISLAMLSVPKAKTVRSFSFFGDSYVYVIFEDGTDIYWARTRVLEYLNQAKEKLPNGVKTSLGSDASGVGWVYQYALVDHTGKHDIGQLKSLQDWYLKTELQSVQGVSEVATVGGMEKTFQIIVDPINLIKYGLDLEQIKQIINKNNRSVGGSVIEMAEAEYMIRSKGYLKTIEDFENIPVKSLKNGSVLFLKDVATIRIGASARRGIAELNGLGDVTGGIVIMRHGENALKTIENVKLKLKEIKNGLPEGVEIITTYDRSNLINRSVDNLFKKVIEEIIVVGLVCFIFLMHFRSAFVALIILPISLILSFIVMNLIGVNANIMSLGGIAIAIGAVVDGAIVMLENNHKHIENFILNKKREPNNIERWDIVLNSSKEVGAPIFFSLLIITLSFLPVFALEGQEGKLFSPLAITKTIIMAISAFLSITLIPAIMGYFVKGKIKTEKENMISRFLISIYKPLLRSALSFPKLIIFLSLIAVGTLYYPISKIGSEFMPELEEGDLLYMPTTMAGISADKAKELLQQTDRLIKTVPEVDTVFGKIGRAETATDPAPLTMLETTITLKDKSEWRDGVTLKDIIEQLDSTVQVAGLTNAWVQPIKTRIDMLSTGIKTPIGIKISGGDIKELENIGIKIEKLLKQLPETKNVYSERISGSRFIDIIPKKESYGKYNLTLDDINLIVSNAIGGMDIGEVILDDQRYPINIRYPIEIRDNLEKIRSLPVITKDGKYLSLSEIAEINISDGSSVYKSENGRLISWVFINTKDISIGEYINKAQNILNENIDLPPRYSYVFSGQYEYMERVKIKLLNIIPVVIILVFFILILAFKSFKQAIVIISTLPFALIGSVWLIYILNYNFSVAVAIGVIALIGVSIEFGVIMTVYINNVFKDKKPESLNEIKELIIEGAVMRIRPKAMTVCTIFLGLFPIMFGSGSGNEIMQKIAAPMIGGMFTAPILSLFIIPIMHLLLCQPLTPKGVSLKKLN